MVLQLPGWALGAARLTSCHLTAVGQAAPLQRSSVVRQPGLAPDPGAVPHPWTPLLWLCRCRVRRSASGQELHAAGKCRLCAQPSRPVFLCQLSHWPAPPSACPAVDPAHPTVAAQNTCSDPGRSVHSAAAVVTGSQPGVQGSSGRMELSDCLLETHSGLNALRVRPEPVHRLCGQPAAGRPHATFLPW